MTFAYSLRMSALSEVGLAAGQAEDVTAGLEAPAVRARLLLEAHLRAIRIFDH